MCYARRQRSSWARIKLSKKLYLKYPLGYLKSLRAIYLSFTFVWVVFSINSDEISIFRTCNALYFSLVVQFSMTVTVHSCGQLSYYITALSLCQYLFLIFLKVFSRSFKGVPRDIQLPLSRWACLLYYFLPFLSRAFFKKFLKTW